MTSFVYFLRPVGQDGPVKIGVSDHPEGRLKTYMAWSPLPLEIVATIRGGLALEAQFHALFASDYLHGEWFKVSDRMAEVIVAIKAGEFDVSALPAPQPIRRTYQRTAETVSASSFTARLNAMERRGVAIPPRVQFARNTYRCTTEETLRRRAIVRDFVLQQKAA